MPTFAQTEAWQVGPTVDSDAEHAAPTYRQERHEIQAGRAPLHLQAAKPRPMTARVNHDMQVTPARVLSREGNHNPAAAGDDVDATSIWGVSDPWGRATPLGAFAPANLLVAGGVGLLAGYLLARVLR